MPDPAFIFAERSKQSDERFDCRNGNAIVPPLEQLQFHVRLQICSGCGSSTPVRAERHSRMMTFYCTGLVACHLALVRPGSLILEKLLNRKVNQNNLLHFHA